MPILTLLAFVLPLGLDSVAVAAAIGATGKLPARLRWRMISKCTTGCTMIAPFLPDHAALL